MTISEVDTGQDIFEGRKPKHTGPSTVVGSDPGGNSFVRDEGDQLGKDIETKVRGLFILPISYPNDNPEGWLDLGKGAVIYNVGHPLAKLLDGPFGLVGYYNMVRVVISTLVKEANEKQQMVSW